jgi:hypothetical protein
MLLLLPVYIGMCIFGSAMIGSYLGTRVQFYFLHQSLKAKSPTCAKLPTA